MQFLSKKQTKHHFAATSRITTTAPKLLYLKVFSETCGSMAVIFKKQNFCTGQILL